MDDVATKNPRSVSGATKKFRLVCIDFLAQTILIIQFQMASLLQMNKRNLQFDSWDSSAIIALSRASRCPTKWRCHIDFTSLES